MISDGLVRSVLISLAILLPTATLGKAMRHQPVPIPIFPDPPPCGSVCKSNTADLFVASSDAYSGSIIETPTPVTTTAVPTALSTAETPGTKQPSGSMALSKLTGGSSVMSIDPLAAQSTTASQPLAKLTGLPLLVSPTSSHNDSLSSATFDVSLNPSISTTTDGISGAFSSSQPSSSLAAAMPTPAATPSDSSTPPPTSVAMAPWTSTTDAGTMPITPAAISQLSVTTSPLLSPASSQSIRVVPTTFTNVPTPHRHMSTTAKSGIAISTSLLAIVLISALTILWRKKRNAETKRRNDLEAKVIWVTRSFNVEAKARSTRSGSTGGSRKDAIIPKTWATVPSEEAKVVKRWADVDAIGGLTRWSRARKGVHQLHG